MFKMMPLFMEYNTSDFQKNMKKVLPVHNFRDSRGPHICLRRWRALLGTKLTLIPAHESLGIMCEPKIRKTFFGLKHLKNDFFHTDE